MTTTGTCPASPQLTGSSQPSLVLSLAYIEPRAGQRGGVLRAHAAAWPKAWPLAWLPLHALQAIWQSGILRPSVTP